MKREESSDCISIINDCIKDRNDEKDIEIYMREEIRSNEKIEMPLEVCKELEKYLKSEYKEKPKEKTAIFNEYNLPKSWAHLFLLLYHEDYAFCADYKAESIFKKIIDIKHFEDAKNDFIAQGVMDDVRYDRTKDLLIEEFIKRYHENKDDLIEQMKFVEEWNTKPFLKRLFDQEKTLSTSYITGMDKLLYDKEIKFESNILIEGYPGAGKTTLALLIGDYGIRASASITVISLLNETRAWKLLLGKSPVFLLVRNV